MIDLSHAPNRRTFVLALAGAGGAVLLGCGQSPDAQARTRTEVRPALAKSRAMTVYRDPSCGCCLAWAEIATKAGFQVAVIDRSDMPVVKSRYGVPDELASCHTAIIGGYAIEGHVPLANVLRLLDRSPVDIRGIAVPGMPRGSPGMEMPDGSGDSFQVFAFDRAGKITVFGP